MLNNKGQSLVMFILIIPIILIILAGVVDIGNIVYNKQELANINKIVLDYGLTHMDDNDTVSQMKKLGIYNQKNINMNIKFQDMEFMVTSSYYVEGIFSNILDTKGYIVKSSYKGYLDQDKKIIKEIK